MGKPLSMDLRSRALDAVDEGMSCRTAARLFEVASATVIRWHDQCRITGGYAAKAQGEETQLRRELGEAGVTGVTVAISTLHRFFARRWITRKKDRSRDRAGPRRRPEPARGMVRRAARARSRTAGVHRRISTATNMTCSHSRCLRD